MGPAVKAYLEFVGRQKKAGDKDYIQNTLTRPRGGFFDAMTAGPGGTASSFVTVERPYASTSAFPWENDSWYMSQ